MKRLFITTLTLLLLIQSFAEAQVAPTPRNAPRTPVNRQSLPDHKPAVPPSSTMQGQIMVIDSEKLRLNDIDIRLFGVVPPQLSASFGPQARATLDNLTSGQMVSCLVRDRDQTGRYLATCHNAANADLAMELLRRGLAVTARGSLAATDLSIPYLSAEAAAQSQKVGLWSVVSPVAAAVTLSAKPAETAKLESLIPAPAPPAAVVDVKAAKADKADAKTVSDDVQAKVSSTVSASSLIPFADETLAVPVDEPGFFARFQLLITGFIMLGTALSILTVVSRQRRQEKRDEMKAIAAALRGELMAARAVCQARLKLLTTETEDKAMTWPRIRATLYQAYVGRLGWLGAELARQIASIYGQASDYAAYYNSDDEARKDVTPKRHALQTLTQHIEEVLPKLAMIEQTGQILSSPNFVAIKPVTSSADPYNTVPTVEKQEAPEASGAKPPIWDAMRKYARERFAEPQAADDETDYAALIEEEMSGLSFTEGEDEAERLPENVTKMRSSGP